MSVTYYQRKTRPRSSGGTPRVRAKILARIVTADTARNPQYYNYCSKIEAGDPYIPCVCKWCLGETGSRYAWGAPCPEVTVPAIMSWKTFSAPVRNTEHALQTNAPELRQSGPQDFGTPRPTQSSKIKIIHKEKLGTLQHASLRGNDVSIPSASISKSVSGVSRVDTIPTAHVSPHPAATRASIISSHHHTPTVEASNLRRAASTNDFNDIQYGVGVHRDIDSLLQKAGTTRRWSSYQNLPVERPTSDLHQLQPDPDITLNDTRLPEQDSIYKQKHINSQSQSPAAARAPTGQTTTTAADMPYGYLSVGKDVYSNRRVVEDPRLSGDPRFSGLSAPHQTLSYGSDRPGANYGSGSTYGPPRYHSPSTFQTPTPHVPGGGVYGQMDNYRLSSTGQVTGDNFSSDITSWQQKHQEQLRRQQYEATQPAVYTSLTSSMPSGPGGMTSFLDPHKLDAVKHAADSIIREKDNIIEKQKTRILQLERQSKESEVDLHKALLHQEEEGGALNIKVQELQYENASLKAQLAELLNGKSSNSHDLEKKLGSTEYDLREVKMLLEKERQQRTIELKSMQELLSSKDTMISEWKEKFSSVMSERDGLEKKMDSMGRYLGDLPTVDDHAKRSNDIRQLEKDKSKYKARAQELERRLMEATKAMKQRQELVDGLKDADANSQQTIRQLQDENARLRSSLGLDEDGEVPLSVQEQLEEYRYDNDRLKAEMEKARKLLEAKHKKQQTIEMRHRGELKALEERLTQEESTVTGLKDQLLGKDQLLKKLRDSVKELGSQNQDLLETKLSLEMNQQELEKQLTGEAHKLECRLLKEMAVCFAELQSLVQICVERAEGQDPNISVLLGAKGVLSLEPDDAQPVGDNVQSLKYKVAKIHDLRKDIDNLREIISNKYAEDMGENLNCTTQ